jgi:hypothetical protein
LALLLKETDESCKNDTRGALLFAMLRRFMSSRFTQGGGERLILWAMLGGLIGFLLGVVLTSLPGGLLGALLGVLVARRIGMIRPRLPRDRQVDRDAHPTHVARQAVHPEGITWYPVQKSQDDR